MYITIKDSSVSHFNKRGFGLISSLIAILIVSVSTLTIVQMSSRFAEKWMDFQVLSTWETLIRNMEQVAASPTNILASISIKQEQKNKKMFIENGKLRRCLQNGRCNKISTPQKFSLFDVAKGEIISSGDGIRYDISGGICPSSSDAYCPFKIKSTIKAFCWQGTCSGTTGNTGLAVEYVITLDHKYGEDRELKNSIYINRSEFKNATRENIGCLRCPKEKHGFPIGPHILGVKDSLRTNCVTNKVKKRTFYIIVP